MVYSALPAAVPPTKKDVFDWSLGEEVTRLRDASGADYGLFIYIRDSYATAGRKALIVTSALLGVNGSGKSTLLKTINGILKPGQGTVLVEGRALKGLSGKEIARRIGYMPQRLHVDPVLPLSVRRFLLLGGRCPEADLAAALAEVGAAELLHSPLQSISGGELQRVLLARALLRAPDLLVLDEPVQGVDLNGQVELYELIARIRMKEQWPQVRSLRKQTTLA